MSQPVYILMGVSGCGKTTVGKLWAQEASLPFFDADDFHPQTNIDKMANGQPLDDTDRQPWLQRMAKEAKEWSETSGAVLACSALKESYRQILESNTAINWIYLSGSFETIFRRMQARSGHYMKPEMLQSQFDALEVPSYGLTLDIEQPIDELVAQIKKKYAMPPKQNIGLYGLGVMGTSLARNIAGKGWSLSVYNRTAPGEETRVKDYLDQYATPQTQGHTDVAQFVASLERPRKIIIMVPAGKAIDAVIDQLSPLMETGDLLMDCGNSQFELTNARMEKLGTKGIHFYGVGVSGGEKGALEGPSIMIGGDTASYPTVAPILESIAAKDAHGIACAALVGPQGSGHFVKMIHNGIEYAEMQLLAELYALLRPSMNNEDMADLFDGWNQGPDNSFLLQITAQILRKKENDSYLLDKVLDQAANKGTGSWSSQLALRLGVPNNMMSEAVFARYVSAFKASRIAWAVVPKEINTTIDLEQIAAAYHMARLINHHQGFELIRLAAEDYGWQIDLSETARIWTKGCIIQSNLMENLVATLGRQQTILQAPDIRDRIHANESKLNYLLQLGLAQRIALPCFSAAWNYWLGMTTASGPANIIQAQRDHFGGHTYRRIDKDGNFTSNWETNG